MTTLRKMLQQALRVSSRGAFSPARWAERWAEGTAAGLEGSKPVKSLDQMPGPSLVSILYDVFFKGNLTRLHELQRTGLQQYGPIWKASFCRIFTVHVADATLIEQVLRQEGQHPMRSDLSSWKDYRKHSGHHYGLLTSEGEEWQTVRSLLGKHMLRPKAVEVFDKTLNSVVDDLIARLRFCRSPEGVVSDIAREFYCFGLEGISSVLFESRIGCLDQVVPEEVERFIQSINTMFGLTLITMFLPRWLYNICPVSWNRFCQCWDYMFDFAKGHIDQLLTAEAEKIARGEKVDGCYITYFLSQTGLPMKTIYSNVTELLLSGVDTISSTMSWCLYELSRHPDIQTALREEVLAIVGDRKIPNATDVARMPLLKATVKEALRLYPVIPANARVIPDRDIQIGGYLIPKNTLITLCHFATSRDPAVFKNPDDFQPTRWLTKDESYHPYASIPFGVGKRSCIGRRIAELKLYLTIARILIQFDVKPDPEGVSVKPKMNTLLVPENAINLQFIERQPTLLS